MYSKNDYRYYLENQLTHSDDFLAHYGVKGMKWKNHNVANTSAQGGRETKDIVQKASEKNTRQLARHIVGTTQYGANEVKTSFKKKKKKSNRKPFTIESLRRVKPKGKKLKGSNIYITHN